MKKVHLALILAGFFLAGQTYAQDPAPYLTEATFTISVDDWADISINGIPIIDSQPYTSAEKGPQTTTAVPKSLCYFQRENILAIEVSDKSVGVTIGQDGVGIAYMLRLRSSDGRVLILTSDDAADHASFYIPDRMAGDPRGWQKMTFDDSQWPEAWSSGPMIPYAARILDPRNDQPISFLSARSSSTYAKFPGERHLFRRKFFLNIGNNPNCEKPMDAPRIEPLVLSQPDRRHPVSLPTKTPTPTPVPTPTPTAVVYPLPLLGQVPVIEGEAPRISRRATATPAFFSVNEPARVAGEAAPKVWRVPTIPMTATPTRAAAGAAAGGQTIVFDQAPANIYMSFADGAGIYRLEVLDKDGGHVRNFYEKKIVGQTEDWAEWDGKNDQGLDCPRGWYFVIFSKDGKTLKKILAGKTSDH